MNKRARVIALLLAVCVCFAGCSAGTNVKDPRGASSFSQETSASSSSQEKAESKKIGYIKSFDAKSGTVDFDPVEWITLDDKARIKELGLSNELDEFPDGYYIYNPSEQTETLKVSVDVKYCIIKENDSIGEETDAKGFERRLKEYQAPYHVTIVNGGVTKIEQQYIP